MCMYVDTFFSFLFLLFPNIVSYDKVLWLRCGCAILCWYWVINEAFDDENKRNILLTLQWCIENRFWNQHLSHTLRTFPLIYRIDFSRNATNTYHLLHRFCGGSSKKYGVWCQRIDIFKCLFNVGPSQVVISSLSSSPSSSAGDRHACDIIKHQRIRAGNETSAGGDMSGLCSCSMNTGCIRHPIPHIHTLFRCVVCFLFPLSLLYGFEWGRGAYCSVDSQREWAWPYAPRYTLHIQRVQCDARTQTHPYGINTR